MPLTQIFFHFPFPKDKNLVSSDVKKKIYRDHLPNFFTPQIMAIPENSFNLTFYLQSF